MFNRRLVALILVRNESIGESVAGLAHFRGQSCAIDARFKNRAGQFGRGELRARFLQSSFTIVPMPRLLVNNELLLLPNRSR